MIKPQVTLLLSKMLKKINSYFLMLTEEADYFQRIGNTLTECTDIRLPGAPPLKLFEVLSDLPSDKNTRTQFITRQLETFSDHKFPVFFVAVMKILLLMPLINT